MIFTFRPAKRESVSLLIGLAGGTGAGKTMSAFEIAKGLAGDKRFAVIDTEAGRAKHYADDYDFDHGDLQPPFRPNAYAEAIAAADSAGYPVIVVDSFSHEHAGEGGLLDWHEEEFQRLGGRDAVKMTAWIKPKMEHRKMVSRLLQVRAHLILCMRAQESVEIVREGGKTVVRPKQSLTGLDGWQPICERNLPYELTVSFLLTAAAPGIPKPIKLPAQLQPFFPLDRPVGVETGRALAAWAAGGTSSAGEPKALEGRVAASGRVSQAVEPDGPMQSASPAAGSLDDEADKLATLLYAYADTETVRRAVAANRADHPIGHHVDWLKKQLERAEAKTPADEGVARSEFKIPEGVAS